MKDKPLQFITVRDSQTGRASSLSIHGRQDTTPPSLVVVGNLEHNAHIRPDSIADADRLIQWLNEWKAAQALQADQGF
jgi:hypothetical protein